MPLPDLIAAIRQIQRQYIDLERAEGSFTRQIKSICRRATCEGYGCNPHEKGGSHRAECVKATADTLRAVEREEPLAEHHEHALISCRALQACRRTIREEKRKLERPRNAMIEDLPVWPWVRDTRGISHGSVARIISGADLLSNRTHVGLWRRFGLAMVIDSSGASVRQRRTRDPVDAEIHGFSPQRRADAFNIGEPILRLNPHYKAIYDARRAQTAQTHPDWTKLHSHRDAHAIMTKAVLRDFWSAWCESKQHGIEDTQRARPHHADKDMPSPKIASSPEPGIARVYARPQANEAH